MKKTKVYLVLLLVFCCVFILFQPTETVGAKTQKPIIKKIDSVVRDHPEGTQIKNEESKEKEPKVRTHLVKDTKQESINFGLKVPYRKNKQSMLPKLGEVKQIGKNKWETIRNPKTGKLMTVIADYVIVKYKPEFYQKNRGESVYTKLAEINKKYNITIVGSCRHRRGAFEKVSIPTGETKVTLLEKLNKDPAIEFAEFDHIRILHWTPSTEPYYNGAGVWGDGQWYIKAYVSGHSKTGGACNMPGGWDRMGVGNYGGDPNIRIANLDTGSAYDNVGAYKKSPELEHMTNVYTDFDTIQNTVYVTPSILVANDGVYRADTIANDTDPYPSPECESHGTSTTHIHSADAENSFVMAGIAWGCSLIPVRVIETVGTTTADFVEGIYYATMLKADVTSMSIGGPFPAAVERTAINDAETNGNFCVASTANGWIAVHFPAGYVNCLAVGAVESDGVIMCPDNEPTLHASAQESGDSWGSCYGDGPTPGFQGDEEGEVDVMAGGGSHDYGTNAQFISYSFPDETCPTSTSDFEVDPPSTFWVSSGTSYSCPVVAGVAALMKSKGASNTDIRLYLRKTAKYKDYDLINDDIYTDNGGDPGDATSQSYNEYYGFGIIDADAALLNAAPSPSIVVAGWIDDNAGDGVIEPGESNTQLVITLKNIGSAQALNVKIAEITTDDFYTNMANFTNISYGTINSEATNDNSGNPIYISVPTSCPIPRNVEFDISITYTDVSLNEFTHDKTITLTYGKFDVVVYDADGNDSCGPDDLDTDSYITQALSDSNYQYTYMKDDLPYDLSGITTLFIAQGHIQWSWILNGYWVDVPYTKIQNWLDEGTGPNNKNLYLEGVSLGRMQTFNEDDPPKPILGESTPYLDGTSFYGDYLQANFKGIGQDDSPGEITRLNGEPGSVAAGMDWWYLSDDTMGSSFNNYVDNIGKSSNYLLKNSSDLEYYALEYDAGTFKTIYQDALLGCFIDGPYTQADYIDAIMGWFGYTAPGSDTTEPAAATLSVFYYATIPGQFELSWQAPGDDGWNGNNSSGHYDLRYVAGDSPGFTWNTATQVASEPTPDSVPYTVEKMLLNLPAGSKYTFSMRTYDETGTNYSQSNYIVVDLPNWLSGCEGIPAAITYVALIQTDDELSEYAIEPYQATLDENSIVYDFYYQEWPADSSAYDVILIIGGYYPHFGTNGLGYFIDDATVRQDIEDFVAGGGSIYMEHDSAYFKIENMLIDKGDEIWLDNVFGLHSDGVDWDAYTGSAADKDEYNHVGGTFGTGNFLGGSTFGANSMMIPEDEIGVASESYRGFDPTPGDPVLLATEYEPIAGSKRLLATVTTVFIEGTPDAYDWAQQIVDYFGMQPLPTGGADTCPPGTVEDLTALPGGSDLSVTLRWTAPGEDVVMGKELGTASTYIIKYSASPITNDTEYNAATSVPTDPPLPSKAGTPESFSFTMPSEGTWYFALKTYDDQVNESALSNDDGLDLDAVLVAPKVMVLDRNPATYWMYYPYDGARDDFDVSTRIFDPICLALEELGVPYDLYIWDLPPVTGVSPDTYNTLMNYDVIFWSDLAFGKENETDTGCLTFQDTWRIADFLASGGRLYQEGNFVPSTYSAHETDGLTMDAHYWKYLGVESAGYYHWWRPTERLIGLEGTWTDGMEFKYDADGGVDLQPGVFDIAPGPRGVNAEYWFEDIDDPDYWHSDNYPPPNVARIVANDTAACKTIVSALPFGGFSTWDGTYPSTRVELMRRILQFFDFGGVEVHTSPEPIFFPKWSNNGKDVAFINGDYGSADIMIVEDAGIEGAPTTVNITNVGIGNIHHMSSITWSPDDQYLLYVSSSAPYPRVFKVKADNTLAAEVWQPTGSVTDWWGTTINVPRFIDPDWSHGTIGAPAKEKIIASLFGEIWAYNADGSGTAWGAVQVTDFQHGVYFVPYSTNPKVFQPKWSPTDDELVFVYRPPGIGVVFSGIYILSDVKNIITGNTNPPTALSDPRITAIFPYGYKPAWSPSWTHDATNIAFCVDKNKSFDNVIFWTDPDGQIASSNFDVYFRAVNLENNWVGIQELNNSEGFEEWSYSGGDKYVYSERSPLNTYHLLAHGSEVFKNSGISRGASKKDILIVNDHSKSYVKMSTSGYGDVKLSIKTPARIKSNGTSGLTYVGEAREIKTSPGAETFKNGAELVVHYTKQEAKDLHQRSFGIYYFDKIKNIWTPISGSVVTTYENGGYVSAKVYKQGTYAIFSGKKASAYTDLTEMRTFPNPYRPNDGKALTGTKIQGIVLDRLPDDIDKIKVYNIAGDLVATSDNGAVHYFEQSDPNWIAPYLTVDPNGAVAVWYGNNDNDKRVASGVYLITIKTTSGHEEVKKVAVIW